MTVEQSERQQQTSTVEFAKWDVQIDSSWTIEDIVRRHEVAVRRDVLGSDHLPATRGTMRSR